MKKLLIFAILTLCLILVHSKLIKVIQVNRHGARTPSSYKNQPLSNFYGEDKKLSQNGYRQHQILGKYVRNRYIHETSFLSDKFNPSEFEIFTTPTQRTVYSSDGFISGIYPGAIIKTKFNQPDFDIRSDDSIPIAPEELPEMTEIPLTVLSKKEYEMFDLMDCKYNGEVLDDIADDKTKYPDVLTVTEAEKKQTAMKLAIFFDKKQDLEESGYQKFLAGINKYTVPYFYHYGKSMEKELGKEAYQILQKINVNKWYSSKVIDTFICNIEISPFFIEILKQFKEAMNVSFDYFLNSNQSKKYAVYSGHDSVIVNILSNLLDENFLKNLIQSTVTNQEAFNFLVPMYAANIMFELHLNESTNKYFVKILYNGIVISYPLRNESNSNGFGEIDYDAFEKMLKSRITPEWEKADCSEAKLYHAEIYPEPSLNDYIFRDGGFYPNH